MSPLDFPAFIPLGEEVTKLQMTIIKFIFLLVIMIHSFLCGANTTRRLTNISLTTSPHFFYLYFFSRDCGRRSLILTSLPLKFPFLFVDSAICISLPGTVRRCCLLTASCCFASLALFVSFALDISCFLCCRILNERNCQLLLRI